MDVMVGEEREHRVSSSSGSKRGRHDNEFQQDGDKRKTDDNELDDENDEEGPRAKADAVKVKGRRSLSGREKAEKIRRQRNCENARKARLRKKMEVTQLQERATELKLENARSKEETRKAREAKTETENQRRQALRTFMRYRCSNVKSYEKWLAVVEETFTLTLPITPYRWFSGGDVVNSNRVVRGIQHLMTDNGSLAVLIESLGCGTLAWRKEMEKGSGHGVELVCDIRDDDMIMTGDSMMCCLLLRTTNAVKHGAKSEWLCRSMMSAKFSRGSSKLAAAELMFDVTSLMQRLQKVVGEGQGMPVVPNTPMGACQPSQEMRVITMAKPPFAVVSCNDSWTKLSGYNQDDVKGRPFSILEGPNTDATALTTLKTEVQRGRAASSLVLNYKRDGSSFLNYLRVYPLIGDSLGTVTHFLGVSQEQPEDPESEPTNEASASIQRDVTHQSSFSSTKVEWPGAAAPSNSFRRCEDSPESSATAVTSPPVTSFSATTGLSVAVTSVSSSTSSSSPSRGLEYRSEPAIFPSVCSRPGSMATGDGAVVGGSRKSNSNFPSSSQAGVAASTGSSIFVGDLGSRGVSAVDAPVAVGGTVVSIHKEVRDNCGSGDMKASARVCLSGSRPRTSSGARSSLDRQQPTRDLGASDRGKEVGTEVKVSQGRLEFPRIQVSCEKQKQNVPTMDEASERRWGCRTARNGLQKAPVQMLSEDEANGRGGGVDVVLAARMRSQKAQSLGDSSHQVVADDDVNSLCSPFERQSTGSEDSPDPFLAWEDVLAGPGDPLQELGAAHMQEELEEAGVRVTKQGTTEVLRCGATPNDRTSSERTGRHRAVSDSITAGGWQVEVAPARDLNSNRRQAESSAGLITGCSSSVSGPPLDVGERVTRSVSDSAVWDCSRSTMSNASNKIGLNLSREGGVFAVSMSTARSERGLGSLAEVKSGQGPFGYPGPFGSSSGVEPAESGGSLPMDDNDELMLTQEALFRSAATVMTDGSSWAIDPGGTPVANSNNVTLPMFSLLDPAAMGAVPYNFVGFNNATTTGAGDWRPLGGLPGDTGRPGVALLGGVGGIAGTGSNGKGMYSTPDQDMTPGKDASTLLEFQMASSWPPLMDPNFYRAAGGIVRSGLQGEGKDVLERRQQPPLGSTVINVGNRGGRSNAPSPRTDPTMASSEMTKQQAPK